MATPRLCSIPDCGKRVYGHGWCSKHYQRWRRHGDPLKGRVSPGTPLAWLNNALRLTTDECLPWPFAQNPSGYGVMRQEDGSNAIVSRMVCERVHGPAPATDADAAHSCNFTPCCNHQHLSWKTREGNMADAIESGTTLRGERHPSAKITESEAREILRLKGHCSQIELAERFDVSRSLIGAIQARKRWKWLD